MSRKLYSRLTIGKTWKVLLLAVLLLPVIGMAQPSLAQREFTSLSLTLRDGRDFYNYDVRAGQDNKFFLEVRNTGTTNITNIRISVEAPEGWTVSATPNEIKSLVRGSVQTLDVNVRPIGTATTQGYNVTFIAESTEVARQVQTFFINVKPTKTWIWIWAGVGVLVIAGFVLIYMRMTKQEK